MKTALMFILLSGLVACGKNGGRQKDSTSTPLRVELNAAETKFANMLLEKEVFSEKELVKEVMKFSENAEEILNRLDTKINVHCQHGICNVTNKDN